MKRLWTTILGLSLACAATTSAQEGAPVGGSGFAGGSYASGGYAGGGYVGGGPVGGSYMGGAPVGGGGCATGDCGTGSCGTGGCLPHCQKHHCPVLYHCQEGGVRYKTHVGCARPVCNPCNNPGWGYFETCWNPWPFPPDYSHCRKVPPAAAVVLNPNAQPGGTLGSYPVQGDPNYRQQPQPQSVPQRAPMPSETRLAPPVQHSQMQPQYMPGTPMPRQPSAPPGYTYQQGMPTQTVPVAIENPYLQQQPMQPYSYQQQPPRGPMQDAPAAPLSTESRVVPPMPQPIPQQPPLPQGYAPRYQ